MLAKHHMTIMVAEKALDKPVVEKKAGVKKAPEKPTAKKIDPIIKQVDETQSFEESEKSAKSVNSLSSKLFST